MVTIGRKLVPLQRVTILEVNQYLENYLWPNFDPESTATFEHVMSTILMINEKLRLVSRHDPLAGSKDFLTEVVVSSFKAGPPGTGKTDTAVQILNVLYHNCPSQRTLIITHSNQALNYLFEKIMERDVPARYLLRLGQGEQELSTDLDFSRQGRVNAMLVRRLELLNEVERLARSLQLPEDVGYTCETAAYFWLLHVYSRWEVFLAACAGNECSQSFVLDRFPFKDFFSDTPKPVFSGESFEKYMRAAKGCFSHLKTVFQELEECRAFELLKSTADRANYLMTKQAKIVAMTCAHPALKRTDFLQLGFKYDNLLMQESAQILEIETFIPMMLQRQEDGHARLKRCILIGDHHQLSPVVKNMAFQKYSHMDQSLFTRFVRLGIPYIELNTQGIARPSLAKLYNWRYRDLGDLSIVKEAPIFHRENAGFSYDYQLVNALPLYPNEQIMWEESVIPSINYSGEGCLALPKLNLQFLTLHDYLLRNFNLFRLESTYEIHEDIQEAVPHLLAHINNEGETAFLGWSQMAVPINDFEIPQADLGVKTIVAVNSSSDLLVQILRFLCYLLFVSSCTSTCSASTDEQQPRLPMDRHAGGSLLYDLEPMWLLVAFVSGVAGVPLFKRISSWCKGSKKIKKRRSRKRIKDPPLGSTNSDKEIDMKSGSTESVTKKTDVDETDDDSVGEKNIVAEGEIAADANDDSAVGIKLGKLLISSIDETALREKGYVVTKGKYEPNRLVTVKCINLSDGKKMEIESDEDEVENDKTEKEMYEINNEIKNLISTDAHPNIIRFHGYGHQNDVHYLCFEQSNYSLDDLPEFAQKQLRNQELKELDDVGKVMLATNWWKAMGNPSPAMINLIRGVVSGLEHIHKSQIIHRNLSPTTVILTSYDLPTLVPKIRDMRISKHVSDSFDHATCFDDPGWEAPEQLLKTEETFATDMFRLGCVIYYAFTGGYHPFGSNLQYRRKNILCNRRIPFGGSMNAEASDLINSLLQLDMNLRPTSTTVLQHPVFWDSKKRLDFLSDASDRLEIDKPNWPKIWKEEKNVFRGFSNWGEQLDEDLLLHIDRVNKDGVKFHTYDFKRLRHLLRMIRNEMNHYWAIPEDIRVRLGNYPEGFDRYITSLFPTLFITVYQFVSRNYMIEEEFNMYFK